MCILGCSSGRWTVYWWDNERNQAWIRTRMSARQFHFLRVRQWKILSFSFVLSSSLRENSFDTGALRSPDSPPPPPIAPLSSTAIQIWWTPERFNVWREWTSPALRKSLPAIAWFPWKANPQLLKFSSQEGKERATSFTPKTQKFLLQSEFSSIQKRRRCNLKLPPSVLYILARNAPKVPTTREKRTVRWNQDFVNAWRYFSSSLSQGWQRWKMIQGRFLCCCTYFSAESSKAWTVLK